MFIETIFIFRYLSAICMSWYESPADNELVKQLDEINQTADSASHHLLFASVCVCVSWCQPQETIFDGLSQPGINFLNEININDV